MTLLWRAACSKYFFWEYAGTTSMFQFREIESYYFQEIEMCHVREIEICHFGEITIEIWDWNLSFREIKLVSFERWKFSFFGGLNMTFSGSWNVAFSGNEKIELSSFWKTEFFIFFGRNHAHKKNWKSKPKTKTESKHTWARTLESLDL